MSREFLEGPHVRSWLIAEATNRVKTPVQMVLSLEKLMVVERGNTP